MSKRETRRKPWVVSKHGRYRFQTGMVTATLVQRGLSMADATVIAKDLRDAISDLKQVTTDELEGILHDLAAARDADLAEPHLDIETAVPPPLVQTRRGVFPYSRGILLRDLMTAGLEIAPATDLSKEVEDWLAHLGLKEVTQSQVDEEVCSLLVERYSPAHARRYRLSDWIRGAELPVVIFIGGATGTGKSTLALELAFRLGIRKVTGTDMVRETMRVVLSPAILPGLHDHSFRGMVHGGQVLSDPRERVLAGFRQQSAQVAAGIRAIVRRAVRENTSLIIEGTHLIPPFRQYIPPEGCHYAGVMLAVPSRRRHKGRFLGRNKIQPQRDPAPYLDAFQSVRWIHDDLLRAAEEANSVVLAKDDLTRTISGAMDYLARGLPIEVGSLPEGIVELVSQPMPTLFVILDGLSDEPNPELDGLTPLASANTPYLDALTGSGGLGQIQTKNKPGDKAPSTDEGLWSLLGIHTGESLGRGLYEAVGKGLDVPPGSVLFRGNLATASDCGAITDRRAGRITKPVAQLVSTLR